MKLGDGKLDSWNRKAMLILCALFAIVVLIAFWRLAQHAQQEAALQSANSAK